MGFILDSFNESESTRSETNTLKDGTSNSRSRTPSMMDVNLNDLALQKPETPAEMQKLITTLKHQSKNLLKQIQLQILDIKKERWEFKHGCNLLNLVIKHYTDYSQLYKNYVQTCLVFEAEETYNYYLPVLSIKLKPIYRVIYLFEEFVNVLRYNTAAKTTSPVEKSNNIHINNLVNKLAAVVKPLYMECVRNISIYENKSKFIECKRELIGFNHYIASAGSGSSNPNSTPGSPIFLSVHTNGHARGHGLSLNLSDPTPSPGPFIMQGMLLKMNNSNLFQNRIFFLFRDVLIYGSRVSSASGFRIHGFLELFESLLESDFKTEDDESSSDATASTSEPGSPTCPRKDNNFELNKSNRFKIITRSEKVVILYALSHEDKEKWLAELNAAVCKAQELNFDVSAEMMANMTTAATTVQSHLPPQESNNNKINYNHRANSIIHVTWHRNITISHNQLCHAMKFNLSGYLLRKFKNSVGWQRLFIIFTNITLFFFKSHEDTTPLASLPLLGYKIEIPNPAATSEDAIITKENVFKLIFKTHVYYFRAESSFTFKRWMNTLERAITIGKKH